MKICLVSADKEFIKQVEKKLNSTGYVDTLIIINSNTSVKDLQDTASDCEILVASPSGFNKLTREHMEKCPNLKYITTMSTGTDWVDLSSAREFDITVSNLRGVNAEAVAEHCFGMIVDLSKRITEADRDLRGNHKVAQGFYLGKDLFQKTLGIIGTGEIGKRVARIAGGFEMEVLGVNKTNRKVKGIKIVDSDTLLVKSDYLAVCIPLTKDTKKLIGKREMELIKTGAVLVSISREGVLDKDAIKAALENNKLFGFGFDADIGFKYKDDNPVLSFNNVIITPHTASVTKEADEAYIKMTLENIKSYMKKSPIRVVN